MDHDWRSYDLIDSMQIDPTYFCLPPSLTICPLTSSSISEANDWNILATEDIPEIWIFGTSTNGVKWRFLQIKYGWTSEIKDGISQVQDGRHEKGENTSKHGLLTLYIFFPSPAGCLSIELGRLHSSREKQRQSEPWAVQEKSGKGFWAWKIGWCPFEVCDSSLYQKLKATDFFQDQLARWFSSSGGIDMQQEQFSHELKFLSNHLPHTVCSVRIAGIPHNSTSFQAFCAVDIFCWGEFQKPPSFWHEKPAIGYGCIRRVLARLLRKGDLR